MKLWLPRLCEALTVRGMKDEILAAGTKFQIGGCPGQRTQFHLFVVRSLIALRLEAGEGCIITALDIKKFFDKQNIIDAMHSLSKAKVNKKLYRVWYRLTENTTIQVMTGAGLTARGLVGPVTGQGGGGAALASALNLDMGVNNYFKGSKDEECYGRIRLQPLIFVDDLLRGARDMNCLRAGCSKLDYVLREKQLEAHPTKSGYLVFGSEQFKAKVENDVKGAPVMLGKVVLKEKCSEAYLGDILCSQGLRASTEASIRERTAKVKGSIYELRALVEDFRMQSVGGMTAGIDLYESCIVSSLLSNSGTWTEIGETEIELLDEKQNTFCRALLQLPKSTPKPSLRASLGLLGMRWRVMESKVLLVLAIRRQEEGGLAREVLEEQLAMGFPGPGKEVSSICEGCAGLPDACRMEVTKEEVKEAIRLDHLMKLKGEMSGKKKLEELSRCDLRRAQDYVGWRVEECRMAFRLQNKMFDCRVNMPTRYKRDLACRACRGDPASGMEDYDKSQDPARGLEDCDESQDHLEVLEVQFFMRVQNKRKKRVV